ncbi:MAG TPA: MBL fold metallo-hydrolase [Chthonomonadaceae bacterium]|nr:MBL fold metallo-hydrolase [Chthonomonadaceae bacterium]
MFHFTPTTPDVRVHALASGSSGNAMLVQAGQTNLLIDAGLPLRTLSPLLSRRGVGVADLDAILLTHEHTDHSCGAGPLARRTGAPLIANAATLAAYAERDTLPFPTRELPTGGVVGIGAIGVRSFPIPHDAAETVGFVLTVGDQRIAYVTDVGSVTSEVRAALCGATLAIVEANHDIDWLWRGPYTEEMKARVASDTGHLSNVSCADLLAERLEEGGPLCVWLAHLSRVNNSPSLARRSVTARIAEQTRVPVALEVALRDHPSVSWRAGTRAIQLSLL